MGFPETREGKQIFQKLGLHTQGEKKPATEQSPHLSLLPALLEPDLHASFHRPPSGYGTPRAVLRRELRAPASSAAGIIAALERSTLSLSSHFLDELGHGSNDNYFCL